MQTLSDLVFGLALSLGAFVLISKPPVDPESLYIGIVYFGFSFLILMNVWHNYSSIMSALPMETRGLLVLNVLLLFVVALEPYLLNVILFANLGVVSEAGSVLYALDVATMNFILAGFMHTLARQEQPLVTVLAARRLRFTRNFVFVFGLIFAVTALPVFWEWPLFSYPSRIVIWILTLPAGWALRVLGWSAESRRA